MKTYDEQTRTERFYATHTTNLGAGRKTIKNSALDCADLLHTVKTIETTLRLLRDQLVHAVGRERQHIQEEIADTIDELAAAEGAYQHAGCVTPPGPPNVRWVQANPYAIQIKQTSF